MTAGRGEDRLRVELRRWRRRMQAPEEYVDGVDARPACFHGHLIGASVRELQDDLAGIRSELEWIRKLIIAAIVTAGVGTLLRMAGLA